MVEKHLTHLPAAKSQVKEKGIQRMGNGVAQVQAYINYCQERKISQHHTLGFTFTKTGVPILCKIGWSSTEKSKDHDEPTQIKMENFYPPKKAFIFPSVLSRP